MPELPDIVVYLQALDRTVAGHTIQSVVVPGIAALKTYDPPIESCEGKKVIATKRLGKRVVLELESDLFLVIHLMIAGRLFWREVKQKATRDSVCIIRFDHGALLLREVAKKKRARIWLHAGEEPMLETHFRTGVEPLEIDSDKFADVLTSTNRTLKRGLTDPSNFSGIGNAYSDEILFVAGLSPVQRTANLSNTEIGKLFQATQQVLQEWTDRLLAESDGKWPGKVTAFRPEMNVHGKFGKACLECGAAIQRIQYAENEVNYCPGCQTNGKILADRSLSRLLKDDWPRSIEELEGFQSPPQ